MPMTDRLYFTPIDAAAELASEANARMSCEQWGAFCRLKLRAWLSPQCSLPNDDVALAQLSGLGKKWKSVGVFVRAQFDELEDDPTRIRNNSQWELYQASMAKHEARVRSGRIGGEAKAKAKQNSSNATPAPERDHSNQNHSQSHSQNQKQELQLPRSDYADRLISAMNETLSHQLGRLYRQVQPDNIPSLKAAARLQEAGVPLAVAEKHLRNQCRLFNPSKHGKGQEPGTLNYFEQGILKAWKSEPTSVGDLMPSLEVVS